MDPSAEATGRARAVRTKNMYCMSVTLDVSRLSGWLNTVASCRVEREASGEGPHADREAALGGGVQAACREDPTVEVEGRARAERTRNIWYMVVTLEVSKLSGWLNADASCRESRGGHAMRSEVYQSEGRRRRASAARAACRRRIDCRFGAGHREEHTMNMLPMFVTLDVSKLSGWLNANASCRVEREA